ncbi:MAG: glycosyltransferase family 39 protein [Oligoflexia bacterium]|nr:glycosyltransferase family 39 protein [Oligoflexia bacterium]
MPPLNAIEKTVPIACLIAAAQGIFYGSRQSMTLDESTTLISLFRAVHQDLSALFFEIHTPLYDVLLGSWLSLLKFDLTSAKQFSALMAAISVALVYKLARAPLGKPAAAIASAITALSPLHVYYSQNGRAYSLFVAMATLSAFFYLPLVRDRGRKASTLYLLSSWLLLCSHFAGFTVLAVQWLHFLLPAVRKRDSKTLFFWLRLQAILLACYAPVLWVIFSRYDLADIPTIYSWVPEPGLKSPLTAFTFLSGSSPVLALFSAAFAISGGIAVFRRKNNPEETAFASYLLAWLLLPSVILLLYSKLHHPVPLYRGIVPSLVPLALLAATGISQLGTRWPALRLFVIPFAVLSASHSYRSFSHDREGWESAKAMPPRDRPEHRILVHPAILAAPAAYHLQRKCFFSTELTNCLAANGIFLGHELAAEVKIAPATTVRFLGHAGQPGSQQKIRELIGNLKRDPGIRFLTEPQRTAKLTHFVFARKPVSGDSLPGEAFR